MKYIFLSLIFLSFGMSAQKVTVELLEQTSHSIEKDAHSALLNEEVYVEYMLDHPKGWHLRMSFIHLIKVYDRQGLDEAFFNLPYYSTTFDKESISSIKGTTYNLKDGKITKSKLHRKAIKDEEINDEYRTKKFLMPDVKVGSIIKVTYNFTTPFIYTIPKWYFQNSIPTDRSHFTFDVPSIFNLTSFPTGTVPLEVVETDENMFPYNVRRINLTGNNVPSAKEDAYLPTFNDYRSGIEYETTSINIPGEGIEDFSKDWNKVAKELMLDEKFGVQINENLGSLKNIVAEAMELDLQKRAKFLYTYVQSNYAWNGKNAIDSKNGLKACIRKKSGSVADINLLLLNLMKKCEIDAHPVLLKSRSSGIMRTNFPSLSGLDYLLVTFKEGRETIFLDASSTVTPFGKLPMRAINLFGLKLRGSAAEVINLSNPNTYKNTVVSDYTINFENSSLDGSSQIRKENYAAMKYRMNELGKTVHQDPENVTSKDDAQVLNISKGNSENEYLETQVLNLKDIDEVIKLTQSESLVSCVEIENDKILLDATLDFGLKTNPFTDESRGVPVFNNFYISKRNVAKIIIPEGYEVESMPEVKNLALPEKDGSFQYSIKQFENELVITYTFNIYKEIFLPEEYPSLKQFYDLVVELNKAKIELRKKS